MKLSTKIAAGAGLLGAIALAAMPAWAQEAAATSAAPPPPLPPPPAATRPTRATPPGC